MPTVHAGTVTTVRVRASFQSVRRNPVRSGSPGSGSTADGAHSGRRVADLARALAGRPSRSSSSPRGSAPCSSPPRCPRRPPPPTRAAITIVGPAVSPDNDDPPTWTFTLPADDTAADHRSAGRGGRAERHRDRDDHHDAPRPVLRRYGDAARSDYVACTTPTANPNEYTYTPPALTVDGDYTFSVHDVETVDDDDDDPARRRLDPDSQVVTGTDQHARQRRGVGDLHPRPTGRPSAFTAEPSPRRARTLAPTWTFTAGADAVSVDCSFTDGTTTTTPACTTSFARR